MSTTIEQVGYRIRKLREAKGFTQKTMADAHKLTSGAYAKIERGEVDISVTRIFELAKLLEVDVDSIIKDPNSGALTKKDTVSMDEFNMLYKQVAQLNQRVETLAASVTRHYGNKPPQRKG